MKVVNYTQSAEFNDSSAIKYLWYDAKNQELYLEFVTGNRAGYKGVPQFHANGFEVTPSPGRYYNTYIKGQFTGIDSDVVFYPLREPVAAPIALTQFVVTMDVSMPVAASTMEAAIEKAGEVVKSQGGTVNKVKSVTAIFE